MDAEVLGRQLAEWILIANVLVIYKKRQSVYLGGRGWRMGIWGGRGVAGKGGGAANMSSNLLR